MIITIDQIIALLPILIIGITIVIVILSISYCRNHFKHALFTITGLILSGIFALSIIWNNRSVYCFDQLIYINSFSVFYTILILFVSIMSSILVYIWLSNYPSNRRDEFYLLLLISSMGGILLTTANHLVILFLGMELISLPLLGLIGYTIFRKKSIESSIKYMILSGISSSFLLFGIALVYMETGFLSFNEIKEALSAHNCNISTASFIQVMLLTIIGLTMIMVSFAFKLSVVPFHLWTPDIYKGSSTIVAMYLATGSKIAVVSVMIRFLLILPDQYYKIFYVFFLVAACCSMLFGSCMAMQQNNIKKILAYSSITNSGYLLIALSTRHINDTITQEAISIYLISYVFANIAIFGIINIISNCCLNKKNLDTLLMYRGLFWRNPILSVVFTITLLSLAGIPMTFGFIGKFYLLLIGISYKLWILIFLMVISSVISIIYYLKIVTNLYLSSISNSVSYNNFDNWIYTPGGIIIIAISVFILIFGVYPQPIINLVSSLLYIT